MHASYLQTENLWLHHLDTDYWKKFVHERFLSPTYDNQETLRNGSLSIYMPEGNKQHYTFAHHIVAEEYVSEFKQGKGERCYWMVHNRNNHYLDATAMASAAASKYGVTMLQDKKTISLQATPKQNAQAKINAVRREQRKERARNNWMARVRRR
jgi:hypothetical protein